MIYDDREALERARRELPFSEASASECLGISGLYRVSAERCRASGQPDDADLCEEFAALWRARAQAAAERQE